MSPPRRRSARLRGSSPVKNKDIATHRLASLIERDETPTTGVEATLDTIVSSPIATPHTGGRIVPAPEEMHPSKIHQSTAKDPDSGLRLGFKDITASTAPILDSPSKKTLASSPFDFRFARPTTGLGPEAQRMMEELRGEALRIKSQLAVERDEENRKAELEQNKALAKRKIAQPKGKVGRFSNVHMAEFKKMDSIEGHASAFRSQASKLSAPTRSLKRTKSKAQLDEDENENPMKSSKTENHASENRTPVKRSKQVGGFVELSTQSPLKGKPVTPAIPRSRSGFLESLTAPTQASLARAASVKQPASNLSNLSRSPSKHLLTSSILRSTTATDMTQLTRSEPSQKFLSTPSKLNQVASFLRGSHSTSEKSMSQTEETGKLNASAKKLNLDKDLPAIPTPGGANGSRPIKRVNFTPKSIRKVADGQNSPSPAKSGIPRAKSILKFGGASPAKLQYPPLPQGEDSMNEVNYPSLAKDSSSHAAGVPSTFTFRSDKTISFGTSPKGFGSSPGQSSVRQVRQSLAPPSMPGSFPEGNKENNPDLPSVPHGIKNKKRHRVSYDEEKAEEEAERSPKKHKACPEGDMLMAPKFQTEKLTTKSRIPSPSKKPGLSLSRLNMLARPKMRK